MARTVHPPEWPDKVMFAAMLTVIAGALGAIFALLRFAGLRIDRSVSDLLYITGAEVSFVLSLGTLALGLVGIRHQAAIWVWLAVGAGILSMGMLGLVPLLCLVAVAFLVRSAAEGEETTHDDRVVAASLWPDKALAASLVLFVAGAVALLQAMLVYAEDLTLPAGIADASGIVAAASLVAGIACLLASHQTYRLRHAWTGFVGAGLAVLTLGFLVIGPALGIIALVLLQKARAENEFDDAPMPA